MANTEKYAQWLVDNQDKKGTPEFETVAKAYKASKTQPQSFMKQQLNELSDVGVGVAGEGAKFLGRILPGVTGEELQAKTERFLTPKGQSLNPEAIEMGRTGADVVASFALPAGAGKLVSKIPQASKYAQALTTGGMDLGSAATKSKLVNALMRGSVGAAEGYGTGTLIDPENAGVSSALQGSIAAGFPAVASLLKRGANKFMTSAVKPDTADFQRGNAQRAINTLLEEGVNPTLHRTIFGRGLDTFNSKIDALNNQISNIIANSSGSVPKQTIIDSLNDLSTKYKFQLAPESDLKAIESVKNEIMANLPDDIPVQLAQKIKTGTYKSLGNKAFGEITGTAKEAQKAGARALKEGIVKAEPSVAPLNAKESDLLNALNVAEKKAYVSLRNNPMGLAPLANDPQGMAAFLADRSPAFKALVARIMYQTGKGVENINKVPMGTVPAALASQGEE